ncbi:MAG: hypothetical protein IMZ53_15280 [Thermoplasmata archaeon]|nr:hypothetical protein [Thermoplasmata archaeon]
MVFGKKENSTGRQDILELGKDTDAQTCERLGGTMGTDGKCRIVHAGVGEDGDVHLKVTKRSGQSPPPA